MKISGVHWLYFAGVMILCVTLGIILADHFQEKRAIRQAALDG